MSVAFVLLRFHLAGSQTSRVRVYVVNEVSPHVKGPICTGVFSKVVSIVVKGPSHGDNL